MQKLFTLIVIGGLTLTIFAQAPQRLSYQAVIRNSSGDLVINHSIGMRISILQGSASGTVVYAETHSATTNANGLATIEIGGGALVSGNFSIINWGSGTYFLKTETDPAGGISYSITGTSQLLSVPYALNSKMSDGVVDNSITSVKISDGAVTTADLGNNSITSGKISDGTIAGADLADNAVTSPKIFDGSVVTADLADNTISTTKLGNLAVSSDKLQNGAVISDKLANSAVTGAKIAQAGATTGQVLKWNSTTWAPANDETGGGITLPYSGSATPEDGAVFKITDDRTSGSVGPIPGEIISIGLHGVTRSTSGRAIVGEAIANSGNATGIVGTTNSPEGRGILGIGPTYGFMVKQPHMTGQSVFRERHIHQQDMVFTVKHPLQQVKIMEFTESRYLFPDMEFTVGHLLQQVQITVFMVRQYLLTDMQVILKGAFMRQAPLPAIPTFSM